MSSTQTKPAKGLAVDDSHRMKPCGGGMLLPPAPGTCGACATAHDPALPHNQQSLYYQMAFHGEHGRWPTWIDAASHCDPKVRDTWFAELRRRGIAIGDEGDEAVDLFYLGLTKKAVIEGASATRRGAVWKVTMRHNVGFGGSRTVSVRNVADAHSAKAAAWRHWTTRADQSKGGAA